MYIKYSSSMQMVYQDRRSLKLLRFVVSLSLLMDVLLDANGRGRLFSIQVEAFRSPGAREVPRNIRTSRAVL